MIRRVLVPLAVVTSMLAAVPIVLLLDAEPRAWAFRAYVAVIAVIVVRSLIRRIDLMGHVTSDSDEANDPFVAPRRIGVAVARLLDRRRAKRRPTFDPSALLVHTGMASAGGAHHRLRPVLQDVAAERLLARTGHGLDDEGMRERIGPHAWNLLRPDRPRPEDRLAPGLSAAEVDAILTDLEAL